MHTDSEDLPVSRIRTITGAAKEGPKFVRRQWMFIAPYTTNHGEKRIVWLKKAADIPIRRHRQVISVATPYDAEWFDYFDKRAKKMSYLEQAVGSNAFGLMRV